ncbi:MAG TPA: sugar phosphate isomerase/epimerase [Solirubrobacteraceae bacterium]|nr:sugar phosphate isomerase/epimerase [Solirubrobacteraceae bacterium]
MSDRAAPQRRGGIAVSPSRASFAPLLYAGMLDEAVGDAVQLGFECLELSMRDPGSIDGAAVAAQLDDAGLRCSAIATGQACLADGLCLSATDETVRAAAIERFGDQVALAHELDASVILGGVRGTLDTRQDGSAARRRAAVDAIRECVQAAGERGVTVLVEPINRYETDFVNRCEEGLELLDEVGGDGVKLLLDTFHMNIEERDLPDAIALAGDRLGYVHMVDSNRHAPGLGHVDFDGVLAALAQIDYRGPFVAEILPYPSDREAAAAAAAFFADRLTRDATAVG